jgi:lysine 2,3-aminomutase
LILHDEELAPILGALFDVPHIATVRVETRALSLVPQRFDASLCSLLGRFGPLYLQTQFNHPREVSPEATEAAGRLARSGVVLQNGAVLLRTINDSPEVIAALHRTLLKIKVRPAFLIEWTAPPRARHFQADPEAGRRIIDHLRETTSGLAVPTPLAYQRLSE